MVSELKLMGSWLAACMQSLMSCTSDQRREIHLEESCNNMARTVTARLRASIASRQIIRHVPLVSHVTCAPDVQTAWRFWLAYKETYRV